MLPKVHIDMTYFVLLTNNKQLSIIFGKKPMNEILTLLITFIKNLSEDVGDLRKLREDLRSDLVLV